MSKEEKLLKEKEELMKKAAKLLAGLQENMIKG